MQNYVKTMSPPSSTKESADASANTDQRVKTSTTARPEMATQHTEIVKNTDAASSFDPDAPLESDSDENNRRRAILAVTPFLVIGLGNLVLLLGWGIEPLWAFAILPPILFCSALAYIVFSTDFLSDRT